MIADTSSQTSPMIEDLSLRHEPVSDLFERPKTAADWQKHRIPQSRVDFFHENGFLAGVPLLSDEQVKVLRGELDELVDPAHPGNSLFYEYNSNEAADKTTVLFHALGAWRVTPAMHDVLWNPAFMVAASQLLDGAVRFWHDQLFCKPAKHGGVVAWHQDYSYWTRTKPIAHLTCWIALDDSSRENGCLQYIPGSHRWPLLPITGLAGDMRAIQTVLSDEQKAAFHETPVEFPKGHASFHHPLTVHGSYANNSARPRRALVINVFRDGVVSDSDDSLLKGVPPIPKGQAMGGQFFPLLYDPKSL